MGLSPARGGVFYSPPRLHFFGHHETEVTSIPPRALRQEISCPIKQHQFQVCKSSADGVGVLSAWTHKRLSFVTVLLRAYFPCKQKISSNRRPSAAGDINASLGSFNSGNFHASIERSDRATRGHILGSGRLLLRRGHHFSLNVHTISITQQDVRLGFWITSLISCEGKENMYLTKQCAPFPLASLPPFTQLFPGLACFETHTVNSLQR